MTSTSFFLDVQGDQKKSFFFVRTKMMHLLLVSTGFYNKRTLLKLFENGRTKIGENDFFCFKHSKLSFLRTQPSSGSYVYPIVQIHL